MTARSYSYLDVSALDGVREKLVAGEAALVLPAALDEVIWANGPGAALFGHSGIVSFVGGDPELSAAAKRQISATPGFPDIGIGRTVAVRLAKGVSSQTVMFSASTVTLPDGEKAVLLSVADALADKRSEADSAARAISGLTSNGGGVALIGASGAVKAASSGFEALGIAADTLEALAIEVAGEIDRMVKRPIPTANGDLPAGIVRLADDPAVSLLMIAHDGASDEETPGDEADTTAVTAVPVSGDADQENEAAATESGQGAPEAASSAADDAIADTSETTAEEDVQVEGSNSGEPDADAPATEVADADVPADVAAGAPPPPEGEDKWYFNGHNQGREEAVGQDNTAPESTNDSAAATDDAAPETPGTAPDPAAAPLRFVWRTDADGRFSALSDNFREAFGAEASDVVGQNFADVAEKLGLDPDHEIAGLMKRRDTWSGRAVLWPIAGTDLVAPVDLAALPVYGRDGTFEGFRGFGIARMADAVVDEHARGLSLTGEMPPQAQEEEGEAAPIVAPDDFAADTDAETHGDDPFQGEVPALALDGGPERRESDKVIRLAERRNQPPAKGLSSSEQQNFQEIGKRLKDADTEDTDTEAVATVDETEAEADNTAETGLAVVETDAEPSSEEAAPLSDDGEVIEIAESEDATDDQNEDRVAGADNAQSAGSDTSAELAPTDTETEAVSGETVSEADDVQDTEAASVTDDAEAVEAAEDSEPLEDQNEELTAQVDDSAAAADDTDEATEFETQDEQEAVETSAAGEELPAAEQTNEDAEEAEAAEASKETAAPAPEREESERRTPVGLSAFLPSAFASGGTGDAALGIDSAVLSRLPLPLLIHSGDELHYANREFLSLTGYRSLAEFDLAGGMDAIFAEPYETDGASDQRLKLRTREGAQFPVHAFLQSVGWQGGNALLLALRRADHAEIAADTADADDLGARLGELRTIIDTATDGVVIIDNDGAIRSVSKPAEALFGYNDTDLTGRPFTSLFAIESQRPAREYLDGLAGNGVASVLNDGREVIGREAQGRFIPLFMTIGRLPHESGFCAVLRDITHWKRAEEELTEARAAAERASSQKTEFLARVSHEIRTPLNAIIGFSELMIDEKFGPIGSDRYRDYLRDINRSGNHVLDLVNDLLDISKIEAGQQELSYEAVSLNDVLGEAVAMMQPQANRERVIIRSSLSSNLPEVVADLRSIRQIALNLLSNAIRYTPAGGQVIVSTVYEPSGDIAMRVRDTGVGMAAAEIEQALKPFKQINAMKRPRGDGTGLGLPLTKAMVEANRARFVIQSTPGEGTLVEIIFPSQRVLAD